VFARIAKAQCVPSQWCQGMCEEYTSDGDTKKRRQQ
jgi:hypothetical protein